MPHLLFFLFFSPDLASIFPLLPCPPTWRGGSKWVRRERFKCNIWHDSFTCVTWLIIFVTWLIIFVTWLLHIYDMSHPNFGLHFTCKYNPLNGRFPDFVSIFPVFFPPRHVRMVKWVWTERLTCDEACHVCMDYAWGMSCMDEACHMWMSPSNANTCMRGMYIVGVCIHGRCVHTCEVHA